LLIIQSCSPRLEDIEENVINDVFLELIGTDYYLEPLPFPPFRPFHPDSLSDGLGYGEPLKVEFEGISDTIEIDSEELRIKDIEEYEKFDWEKYYREVEEFEYKLNNRKPDPSRLVVLFSDTLIIFNRTSSLNSILTEKGFKQNFEVDTTWRYLAIKLVDSIQYTKKINLSEIIETGRYELESPNNYEKKEGERIIGAITFSRVAFNDDLNKGCFYYSFYCGNECGEGVMFFVKKEDGKWIIEGSRELWIS